MSKGSFHTVPLTRRPVALFGWAGSHEAVVNTLGTVRFGAMGAPVERTSSPPKQFTDSRGRKGITWITSALSPFVLSTYRSRPLYLISNLSIPALSMGGMSSRQRAITNEGSLFIFPQHGFLRMLRLSSRVKFLTATAIIS